MSPAPGTETATCRICGKPWRPVQRGQCLYCGSDAAPAAPTEHSEFSENYESPDDSPSPRDESSQARGLGDSLAALAAEAITQIASSPHSHWREGGAGGTCRTCEAASDRAKELRARLDALLAEAAAPETEGCFCANDLPSGTHYRGCLNPAHAGDEGLAALVVDLTKYGPGGNIEKALGPQVVTVAWLLNTLQAILDGKPHTLAEPTPQWDLAAHDQRAQALTTAAEQLTGVSARAAELLGEWAEAGSC